MLRMVLLISILLGSVGSYAETATQVTQLKCDAKQIGVDSWVEFLSFRLDEVERDRWFNDIEVKFEDLSLDIDIHIDKISQHRMYSIIWISDSKLDKRENLILSSSAWDPRHNITFKYNQKTYEIACRYALD